MQPPAHSPLGRAEILLPAPPGADGHPCRAGLCRHRRCWAPGHRASRAAASVRPSPDHCRSTDRSEIAPFHWCGFPSPPVPHRGSQSRSHRQLRQRWECPGWSLSRAGCPPPACRAAPGVNRAADRIPAQLPAGPAAPACAPQPEPGYRVCGLAGSPVCRAPDSPDRQAGCGIA